MAGNAEGKPDERNGRRRKGVAFFVPITAGVVGALVAGALIVLYWRIPSQRPLLGFAGVVGGAAAGVTSAYYIGASLRETARAEKLTRTFELMSRWGHPSFWPARNTVKKIIDELHWKKSEQERLAWIRKTIHADETLEHSIIMSLDFLEEISLAIHEDLVDAEVLYRYFGGSFQRTFETLTPWIEAARDKRPMLYTELENLYDEWKKR